jgi:hypothetical protein
MFALSKAISGLGEEHRVRTRLIMVAGALVLLLLLPGTAHDYAAGFASGDSVYVPDPVVHWPANPRSSTVVRHVFRVYSLGLRPLQVRMEPSCGCISLSCNEASIPALCWTYLSVAVPFDPAGAEEERDITMETGRVDKPYVFLFFVR